MNDLCRTILEADEDDLYFLLKWAENWIEDWGTDEECRQFEEIKSRYPLSEAPEGERKQNA